MPGTRAAKLTARIFLKLILGVFGVLVIALTAVNFLASRVAEKTYVAKLTRELADKGRMLDTFGIERYANDSMFGKMAAASGARLTLVAPNGAVVADSDANAATMENHAQRPEVAQALSGRTGSDTRMSQTVHHNFLYVAIPVQGELPDSWQ